jgi:hypothetical protein
VVHSGWQLAPEQQHATCAATGTCAEHSNATLDSCSSHHRRQTGFHVRVFTQYQMDRSKEGPNPRGIWGSLDFNTVVVVVSRGAWGGRLTQEPYLLFSKSSMCEALPECRQEGGTWGMTASPHQLPAVERQPDTHCMPRSCWQVLLVDFYLGLSVLCCDSSRCAVRCAAAG